MTLRILLENHRLPQALQSVLHLDLTMLSPVLCSVLLFCAFWSFCGLTPPH